MGGWASVESGRAGGHPLRELGRMRLVAVGMRREPNRTSVSKQCEVTVITSPIGSKWHGEAALRRNVLVAPLYDNLDFFKALLNNSRDNAAGACQMRADDGAQDPSIW